MFSLAEMVWGPFAAGRLVVETTEVHELCLQPDRAAREQPRAQGHRARVLLPLGSPGWLCRGLWGGGGSSWEDRAAGGAIRAL